MPERTFADVTTLPGAPQSPSILAAAAVARRRVEKSFSSSALFSPSDLGVIPALSADEILIGATLAVGGFCAVSEVEGSCLRDGQLRSRSDGASDDDDDDDDDGADGGGCRGDASSDRAGGGDGGYVVKALSPAARSDPLRFREGVADLVAETRILAALDHPNVVSVRARAAGDAFRPGYFVVLDRLGDTLEERIERWAGTRGGGFLAGTKAKAAKKLGSDRLLGERLAAALGLCSALEYLHSLDIVYRDVKAKNVGFDARGDVKLFDMGIARELCLRDVVSIKDGTYKLTARVGTARYMSPEVARGEPYGTAVDVYGFAVLLWEIIALKKPFCGWDVEKHRAEVVVGGFRPKVKSTWPEKVKKIMEQGWDDDAKARPRMHDIRSLLSEELVRVQGSSRRRAIKPEGTKRRRSSRSTVDLQTMVPETFSLPQ